MPEILIVEDEPEIRTVFAYLLEGRYKIHLTSSGKGALNQFCVHKNIDLILLDYRLPDMTGVEVLKRTKQIRPSVPAIFITAYGSEDVAVRAFTAGAKDYLTKPFSYSDLVERIEFYLSLKSSCSSSQRTVMYLPDKADIGLSANAQSPNFFKIQKALKYIQDNYAANISLDAAADKACMSRYHFSRVFKEVMGVSFKKYLISLKMEKAKVILRNSSLRVSEIANTVGYEETAHFVKMFKKIADCTPSEYRRTQQYRGRRE